MYKRPKTKHSNVLQKTADPYSFIIICLYEKINKVVKFERFPVKKEEKNETRSNIADAAQTSFVEYLPYLLKQIAHRAPHGATGSLLLMVLFFSVIAYYILL